MSRRKQAKPRFLKHDENTDGENPIATTSTAENHVNDDSGEDDDQDDEEFDEDGDEGKKYKIEDEDYQDGGAGGDDDEEGGEDEDENNSEDEEIDDDESSDSFCSDVFSSHTSSSFSPSLSDGIATPNSMTQMEHENVVANGGGGCAEGAAGIVGGDGGGINIQNTKKSTDGRNTIENGKTPKEHHHHGHHHAGLSNKSSKMKVGSDGSYHCQFCEKTFPRLGYLKKHEQSHAEHMPFKCDYCARLFKHKRSRDRHTKLHTGDRRYKCPHCEAAFSRSDHLKIHMKTHDNQKPFQCTVCNRGYNTAAALTSHMQNHKKQAALTGNPMLTYSPRSTGSGSSTTSSTQKRKYSSSLEHPYGGGTRLSCIYCTKSDFTTLEQLNIHVQAMHAPRIETPHSVPSPNLTLTCEFCTMKFPTIQSLLHHLKTSHLDRISSPSSYLEHFNRMSYDLYASSPARAGSGGGITFEPVIKSEAKTPDDKLLEKSNSTPPIKIKQEDEQDSPTDLSQPKIRKVVKEEPTNHNNNNIEVPATPASPVAGGTFLCNQCNAALPDFESFRKHLKTHLESGVGSYLCQHCGVAFNEQQIYEKHIFSHFLITSSEFTCPQSCGKSFAKQEEYQKHMLETHIHNLFKCELCAEIFDTKVAIQVHMAVAHSNEIKLSRCSACMEVFRNERDFRHHVRTRHIVSGAVQCIFCRTICSSELDMHFHLAAHARQYRCPVCPESFHVEFLLDRHLQMHHAKDGYHQKAITNNNNNNIEYGSSSINKIPYGFPSKFYNNDTALPSKHPNLLHGLYDTINKTQRFTSENGFLSPSSKDLLGLYNNRQDMISKLNTFYSSSSNDYHAQQPQHRFPPSQHHHQSSTTPEAAPPQPNHKNHFHPSAGNGDENAGKTANRYHAPAASADKGYSCGMCERNDFSTESEVHTHRKLAHNLKTGVSLRCAYCNGDFRSRSELENHMKVTHNTSGKHKCLICDEIFPSPAVLAEHKLTHCKVGPSGRCSHCSAALKDVTFFKSHLAEHNGHDIPIQCICCRQTLNSEFEIGLHAKFHTKSSDIKENTCALCLETIPSNAETRVCENCYKKHNLNLKTQKNMLTNMNTEMQCNLCKKFYPSSLKLQEHLIEHTFAGCEDRGYICYICSSVFTASAGLQAHIVEHGLNARPYDCSSCTAKFFFRSELEHHTFEHEHMNPTKRPSSNNPPPIPPLPPTDITNRSRTASAPPPPEPPRENILKEEKLDSDDDFVEPTPDNSEGIQRPEDDDEEYIEVDNVDGSTAEKEAKPLEPPMDGGSTETQQKH